jgi:hypothetical protein
MVATQGVQNGRQWRLAWSLIELVKDADAGWPLRSRASDGSIGDAAHQARHSDHNPDAQGVVCAVDLTNDPFHGFDAWSIAQHLAGEIAAGRERRVKYLISGNPARPQDGDLIFHDVNGTWIWSRNGSNAHINHHLHVSVLDDPILRDSTARWSLAIAPPAPQPSPHPKGPDMVIVQTETSSHTTDGATGFRIISPATQAKLIAAGIPVIKMSNAELTAWVGPTAAKTGNGVRRLFHSM